MAQDLAFTSIHLAVYMVKHYGIDVLQCTVHVLNKRYSLYEHDIDNFRAMCVPFKHAPELSQEKTKKYFETIHKQ